MKLAGPAGCTMAPGVPASGSSAENLPRILCFLACLSLGRTELLCVCVRVAGCGSCSWTEGSSGMGALALVELTLDLWGCPPQPPRYQPCLGPCFQE